MLFSRHRRIGLEPTSRIDLKQDFDPSKWKEHRFGLPEKRWDQLKGRRFWVTGGGTGYGQSIALALAAAGSTIFISGRRVEKLQETLDEGRAQGIATKKVIPVAADLTSVISLSEAVQKISQHTDVLDGVVSCAAIPQQRERSFPLLDGSLDSWKAIQETNVTGQWLTCRAALPLLLSDEYFRVVFFGSTAAWGDTPGVGPYNVSKAALNSLGMSLAAECVAKYPEKDIQINVLDPGEAKTEMNQGSFNSPYLAASMVLVLLSHPPGGPNGNFFHSDGRSLGFGFKKPYPIDILSV